MKPICSFSQYARVLSHFRSVMLYRFCTLTIGTTLRARSISRVILRIIQCGESCRRSALPSARLANLPPAPWDRHGAIDRDRFDRALAASDFCRHIVEIFRPAVWHPLVRARPGIAAFRRDDEPFRIRIKRFCDQQFSVSGPYASAVSIKFAPSSTARRRTLRAFSLSGGQPQIPSPVSRIAPNPSRLTDKSPPMLKVGLSPAEAAAKSVAALPAKSALRLRAWHEGITGGSGPLRQLARCLL